MDTIRIDRKSTLMVAHRGVSGLEKENTLAAFIAAGNRSYYGVETDVHRTGDGKFIIIHDSNPKRVSGVSCRVENEDFETLRKINLKDIDDVTERIDLHMPSLEEYIRICKKYDKVCVLELKEAMSEQDVIEIAETAKREEYIDNIIFISFCLDNLKYLRKNYPTQPAQYLFGSFYDDVWDALVKYKLDIDAHSSCVNEEVVKKAHSLGMKVNCWTVDDPEECNRLVGCGVDFITSDILE